MPLYSYKNGDLEIEILQKMSEDHPHYLVRISDDSPTTNMIFVNDDGVEERSVPTEVGIYPKGTYHRVYSFAVNIDSKQPKTVGDLAQKNTDEKIKRGELKPRKEKVRPWWRPKTDKVDTGLAKLSKKQRMNYIATGKK